MNNNFHTPDKRKLKNEKIKNCRDLENVNWTVVQIVKSNLKQPERKNLGVFSP